MAVVLEPGRPLVDAELLGRAPAWRKRSAVVSSPSDRLPPKVAHAAIGPAEHEVQAGDTGDEGRGRLAREMGALGADEVVELFGEPVGGGRRGRPGGLGEGPAAVGGAGTEHDLRARGGGPGRRGPQCRTRGRRHRPRRRRRPLGGGQARLLRRPGGRHLVCLGLQMVTVRPGCSAIAAPRRAPAGCTARLVAPRRVTRVSSRPRRRRRGSSPGRRRDRRGDRGAAGGVLEPQPTGRGAGSRAGRHEKGDRQGVGSAGRQVGITGRSIAPRLYVALGLSGKFNHMVGVRAAGTVLAVNADPRRRCSPLRCGHRGRLARRRPLLRRRPATAAGGGRRKARSPTKQTEPERPRPSVEADSTRRPCRALSTWRAHCSVRVLARWTSPNRRPCTRHLRSSRRRQRNSKCLYCPVAPCTFDRDGAGRAIRG